MPGNPSKKHTAWFIILVLIVFLFSTHEVTTAQPVETLVVTFIDVGQGDSSLLRTSSGTDILIDAGPESAGETVLSFLTAEGITELDVIVISHNHADHLGGLVEVLQSPITVGQILYNGNDCTTLICQDVWAEIGKRGMTPQAVDAGDSFTWGSVTTAVLNPQTTATGDENEDSIVMHVDFYEVDLLYTGDIGSAAETTLLDSGALIPIELLKVAHHGSDASTSSEFLTAVTPQVAVISVGAENAYGHPGEETLNRLVDLEIAVHRTDLEGTLTFTFLPEGFAPEPILIYFPLIRSKGEK